MSRKVTIRVLDLVDEGVLDAREVLRNALNYMSEDDVADFARCEGYLEDEENE